MRKRSWSLRPGNFEANRRIKLSTWTRNITISCLVSITWDPAWLFTVVSAKFLSHLFLQDSKESVHLFMRKSLVDTNDCSGKLGITPGESKNATYIGPSTLLLHLLRFDFCFWGFQKCLPREERCNMQCKWPSSARAHYTYYTFPVQATS